MQQPDKEVYLCAVYMVALNGGLIMVWSFHFQSELQRPKDYTCFQRSSVKTVTKRYGIRGWIDRVWISTDVYGKTNLFDCNVYGLCCAVLVSELVLLFKLCRYMFATFVMLVLSRILLLVVFFIVNLVSLSIKICIAFAIHDALPLFKMSWFCSKLLRYAHLINKLVDMNELISEGAKNG